MKLPEGKTLYDILEIDKKQVDQDENLIKKAYRRLALKYHPDKQLKKDQDAGTEKENTTQHFQLVGFAYSILNDASKRKHYDLTKELDGADSFLTGDKDWTDYFKELWQGVVSEETITAHALKYQGSEEEQEDVLKYYTNLKGNMDHILAHVEHSKAADVPRFIDIINTAIQNKKVETYPAFAKTTTKSAQLRRIQKEKAETIAAEKAKAKEKKDTTEKQDDGNDGLDSLKEMMKARQVQRKNQMEEMLTKMEEKATKKMTSNKNKPSSTTSNKGQKRHHDNEDAAKTRKKTTKRT
ncbi:DnaJ domain-containing protein [Chlamydoabsidia padenii]|nr:DnaJ domain-containing protein [Chlamydoabsidia padenii]